MPLRPVLFAIFLILLMPPVVRGADRDEIFSFAAALEAEGDHYRAITEYKRFLHFFPEDPKAPAALLAIAESYMAGRRWDDAEETVDRIIDRFPNRPAAERAERLRAEIARSRGDLPGARQLYRRLLEKADDPAERRRLRRRLAWVLIEEGRYEEAREVLGPPEGDSTGGLDAELARLSELPLKSPALAGGLSALLPGAGQLYAERPRDAALALLLNAAFLWGALDAFEGGNEAVGAILLFFEAGWYTGNIFNAVNSTQKYNRHLRSEATEPLRNRLGLALGRSGERLTFGLAGRF